MRTRNSFIGKLSMLLGAALSLTGCFGAAEDLSSDAELQQQLPIFDPEDLDGPIIIRDREPPPPRPTLTALMNEFANYDMNHDGIIEINSLKPVFANPEPYTSRPNGLLIVFVDPRLVSDDPTIKFSDALMRLWLAFYGTDLHEEGYFPYFVEADVYRGAEHQDGRTLLAMRRFLKRVREHYPLSGTILMGSFPEAGIAHARLVKPHADGEITFESGTRKTVSNTDYLNLDAEFITPRAEIVLADLDGGWESIYRKEPFTFKAYKALPELPTASYPRTGQTITTPFYREANRPFEDVFFVEDEQVDTSVSNGKVTLSIRSIDERSPETTSADRAQPNRIARPEIMVSRINPLHVAISPTTSELDLDGKGPLDENGKPQALRFYRNVKVQWARDPKLERELVADYIARTHAFRLGHQPSNAFRTSSIRQIDSGLKSPSSFNELLRKAADGFGASLVYDDANLVDYVAWLRAPAVLRGVASHSNEYLSKFGPAQSALALELITGGKPWRWVSTLVGNEYHVEPSFDGMLEDAKFHLYRTLWENKALENAGQSFMIHDGCDVMKPSNYRTVPYSHVTYGRSGTDGNVQNAESILFYGNALGIMGRNKVFNDTPRGYVEKVKSTGRFGLGWRGYFEADSADPELDERSVPYGEERRERTYRRKRSYYWSFIGDFTLKLKY